MNIIILTLFVPILSSCGKKSFSGPYADAKRAVWELRKHKDKHKNPYVTYEENSSLIQTETLTLENTDLILLDFQNHNDQNIEVVCEALKDKLQGLEVPYIYCSNDITLYKTLKALQGLECKEIGFILKDVSKDETTLLHGIKGLSRLWIQSGEPEPSWLSEFPQIKELIIQGISGGGLKTAPSLPQLTTLYTKQDDFGAAVAYAYRCSNPQLTSINGVAAKDYDPEKNLNENDLDYYHLYIQQIDIDGIDTSSFQHIAFDEAKLHGQIAVVSYGTYPAISSFTVNDQDDISEDLKKALTDSPTKRDVIIRITGSSTVVGHYTNGKVATSSSTCFEIIDLDAKTITEKKYMEDMHGTPDTTITNGVGKGGKVGFTRKKAWEAITDLYQKCYKSS